MRLLSSLAVISGLTLAAPAFAATITYSISGTFGSGVGTNSLLGHPYTAPNAEWGITFTVDEVPTITAPQTDYFPIPFSGFVYTLGGVDSGLGADVTEIDFSDTTFSGMFDVIFDSIDDSIGFTGPQMWTGTTSSPTMLSGVFVDDGSGGSNVDGFFIGPGLNNLQSNNGVAVIGTLNAVPEPSTVAMMFGGALGLLALKRRRAA